MPGTQLSVSTLLITVGRLQRPALAMWGGRQRGFGAVALQGVQHARRLAAHVAPDAHVQVHLETEVAAQDALAEVAPGVSLLERPGEDGERLVVLRPQEDVAGRRLDRVAGEGHAFDQQVRAAFHEKAVLEGARLHLVGVADDVLGRRRVGAHGHEAPLASGRRSRRRRGRAGRRRFTTCVTSAGASSRSGLAQRLVAAGRLVVVDAERPAVGAEGAGQRTFVVRRHVGPSVTHSGPGSRRCARGQLAVEVLVDHHGRGVVACAEADDGQQREAAVGVVSPSSIAESRGDVVAHRS